MSELQPTPADEYPIRREQTISLPSGAVALIKQPSAFLMMRRGQLPAELREIMTRGEAAPEPMTEAEMFTVLDCLVAAAYVSPKVTFKRKKGALCIDDIPDEDRHAVIAALKLREAV